MPIPTIAWDPENRAVRLIDQTKLPHVLEYKVYRNYHEVARAIKALEVRGAPAIGVTAAFGVVVGMQDTQATTYSQFKAELNKVIGVLAATRPTAVNLFWALQRMEQAVQANQQHPIPVLKARLLAEAQTILEEDKAICRSIGRHGAALLRQGDTVLTHCNAGALATADYGTALAVIYSALEQGKAVHVMADETRPVFQGARLTAWELQQAGVDVTLICDNMAGQVMQQGWINAVIVGADRIAANGDVANKIGTYSVAILAKEHQIPFYVAAPRSTIDFSLATGQGIPIEERSQDEVTQWYGKAIAPAGIKVYNPAFDVTPACYVSAIITEKGVVRPPYPENLAKLQDG